MLGTFLAAVLLTQSLGRFVEECAPDGADAGGCPSRGSALVKTAMLDSALEGLQEEDGGAFAAVAWATGPFGDCVESCGPMRFRKVECRSVFDGRAAPEESCKGAKPATSQECVCGGLELCVPAQGACPPAHEGPRDPETGYEELGCFAAPERAGAQAGAQAGALGEIVDHADMTCMNWTSREPCSGGLPFYSYTDPSMSAKKCAAFCVERGLDIFGLEQRSTCRCGASALNEEVWHGEAPRPGLLFEPSRLAAARAGCPLRAFRYAGHYESGGLPDELWRFREGDLEYVDTVARGREVHEEDGGITEGRMEFGEGGAPQAAGQAQALGQVAGNATVPSWTRPCWPGNCGPGRGPWPTRSKTPLPGMGGDWEEYVIVDYDFAPGLDAARKEAFRKAVLVWADHSCINLRERAGRTLGIRVGVFDETQCWVSGCGQGYTQLNLGFCKSLRELGSIVHEIGHAVGMAHEQKRPDAARSYHGHGPFLKVRWEAIPSDWRDQYLPDMRSYTGSAAAGPGDGTAGWAAYDFDSIMHYPAQYFDTIPESAKKLVGQHMTLSKGDVDQINDMYHCRHKGQGPPPPTAFSCGGSKGCSSNMFCENGLCVDKYPANRETDDYSKCQSGKGVCGRCADADNRVNGPYRCSVDRDCGGGLKCGSWWHNCWGCKCQCYRR